MVEPSLLVALMVKSSHHDAQLLLVATEAIPNCFFAGRVSTASIVIGKVTTQLVGRKKAKVPESWGREPARTRDTLMRAWLFKCWFSAPPIYELAWHCANCAPAKCERQRHASS